MKPTPHRELTAHVGGLRILDSKNAVHLNLEYLFLISRGVVNGHYSETEHEDLFRELRFILWSNRQWYTTHEDFMVALRDRRDRYPRSHWWLWIEEM